MNFKVCLFFQEYACTVIDIIARRLRIAFLDTKATSDMLPKVVKIMGDELNWDQKTRKVYKTIKCLNRKGFLCYW